MRKEAINTFQEGLNYDLNPITTPNNVLTDCVNGTFITFNGDELALQNDAGNTKILIPGTTDNYVKLSPGFYPLGIKEYGGVLYIVSGSKVQIDDSITNWNINTVYEIGQIVRFNNKFYINGIENNTNPIIDSDLLIGEIDSEILLMEDGSQSLAENGWTEVILDSESYYDLIEFGSYPSPEFAGNRQFENQISVNLDSSNSLYSPKIMNNDIFKSGRYVTFVSDPTFIDSTKTGWISHIDSTGKYAPRLYKVKLWHQLSNGLIDLTEDVMTKYKLFRSKSPSGKSLFWFNQSNFAYFCPNQYKGKLALSMEIEPLVSFKLYEFPTLTFDGNQYNFIIKVKGDSGTNTTLKFSGMSIKLIVDDIVKQEIGMLDSGSITYDQYTDVYTATLFMPNNDTYKNKIVRYEIIPSLVIVDPFDEIPTPYEKNDYIESFPIEFRNNYIITGERFVTSEASTIVFDLVDGICNNETGIHTYQAAIIKNLSGQNLDSELNPTESTYAFVLDGFITSYNIIGKYTISVNGKPTVMTDPLPSVSEDIIQVFQDEIVSFESASCKQVTATIITSNPISLNDIKINQGLEDLSDNIIRIDDNTYTCSVVPGLTFTIEIKKSGFTTVYHSSTISTNKTIKLALIPKFNSEIWDSGIQGSYTIGVYWGYSDPNLTTINGIVSSAGYITLNLESESRYVGTTTIKRLVNGITMSITNGTSFNGGDYDNISGSEGMYKRYGDYIFLTDNNIPCEYLGTINPI